MIASFPWYDLPSVRWANDTLWQAMGLGGELDRSTPTEGQWRDEDLFVTQACGLDLFLADAPIEPVLAPVFDLDCAAGAYYSYLVGSRTGVAAVNSLSSRSGLSALLTVAEPSSLIVTGSHRASLDAIRRGVADMASIDAVTWHILKRDETACVDGVRVLEKTGDAPAPPYVVPRSAGGGEAVRLITAAMGDPVTAAARGALLLRGVMPVAMADYASVQSEYGAIVDRIPETITALSCR